MVSSGAMEVVGERGRVVAAQLSQPFSGFHTSIAAPADNRVSVVSRGVMIRIRGAGGAYAGHAAIFVVGGCCHSRESACAASKQQYVARRDFRICAAIAPDVPERPDILSSIRSGTAGFNLPTGLADLLGCRAGEVDHAPVLRRKTWLPKMLAQTTPQPSRSDRIL
jgi:hypothetical protein